ENSVQNVGYADGKEGKVFLQAKQRAEWFVVDAGRIQTLCEESNSSCGERFVLQLDWKKAGTNGAGKEQRCARFLNGDVPAKDGRVAGAEGSEYYGSSAGRVGIIYHRDKDLSRLTARQPDSRPGDLGSLSGEREDVRDVAGGKLAHGVIDD